MSGAEGRTPGILLLYLRPPTFFADASTITEHINAFGEFSRFPVTKVNVGRGFPPTSPAAASTR
jgi:hypothetical protein